MDRPSVSEFEAVRRLEGFDEVVARDWQAGAVLAAARTSNDTAPSAPSTGRRADVRSAERPVLIAAAAG